jgi:hypothetical protein
MTEPRLGEFIEGSLPERDAVHVAIIPLIAGERLYPGQLFRLAYSQPTIALRGSSNSVGVVDPFLRADDVAIEKGVQFWGLLFPGTVTGMRHHWQHPAFDTPSEPMNSSELWLRQFADKWNIDFAELIRAGVGEEEPDWRYVTAKGIDLHSSRDLDTHDEELFWQHLASYTGKTFTKQHQEALKWSCSC